jgi:hypothetical protein
MKRCAVVLSLLVAAGCGKQVPSDREFCEQRERAYELAYPEEPHPDHDQRVGMCERGVADEHRSDVDRNGRDMFQRRLACADHLGEGPPLDAWRAMKNCESATLFLK